MFTINEKVYLNLQEQVGKNKNDVCFIKNLVETGVLNIKYFDELPSNAEKGEFSLTEGEIYIFDTSWINLGKFPAEGPQGETGPQGPQGPKGDMGSKIYVGGTAPTLLAKEGDIYIQYNGDIYTFTNKWNLFASFRGPQGPQGALGPQGETGPQGPRGEIGPQGEPSPIFSFKGVVSNISELPTPESVSSDSAYVVRNPNTLTSVIYVISEGQWVGVATVASVNSASNTSFSPVEDISATNVQDALEEVNNKINDLTADLIYYDNNGTDLTSDNVEQAIDELDDKFNDLNERVENSINELTENKANKDGYYAGMHVGLADNVASPDGVTDIAQYDFRPTAGTASVTDGDAAIKSIRGNTWVYNQLAKITQTAQTLRGITYTLNGSSLSISGTSQQGENKVIGTFKVIAGHKYFADTIFTKGIPTNTTYYLKWKSVSYGEDIGQGVFFTSTTTEDEAYIIFTIHSSGVAVDCEFKARVYDLTKWFGPGKEPTTVAEFNNLTRGIIGWYYSEGELLNAKIDGVKSVGFNAFDGELELGSFDLENNGGNVLVANNIRTKNFISVIGGQNYTLTWVNATNQDSAKQTVICEYDKDQNLIKYTITYLDFTTRQVFTLQDNTCYVRLNWYIINDFISIPTNAQICFHLTHSGYRNGQYEPYWNEIRQLPVNDYFPEGMKSAGNAYDELTPKRATVRIGSRNYQEGDENNPDVTTDGRTTNYELDNPIVTEIEQTRAIDWFYRMSDFGTEEQLIGEEYQIPCVLETFYMNNLRDKLRNLPDIPKPPETGSYVLKSINGVITWEEE